jgi:hypothetical protein
VLVDIGPHGTVVNHDALADGLEKVSHKSCRWSSVIGRSSLAESNPAGTARSRVRTNDLRGTANDGSNAQTPTHGGAGASSHSSL